MCYWLPKFLLFFFKLSFSLCAHLCVRVDEKVEIGNRTDLVTTTSQPSVYLSAQTVKGICPTAENLTRSQSITDAIEERAPQNTEFVKRRATTFDIDMPTQRQGKNAPRRRLFVSFSFSLLYLPLLGFHVMLKRREGIRVITFLL